MGFETRAPQAKFVSISNGAMYYKVNKEDVPNTPGAIAVKGVSKDGNPYSFYKKEYSSFTGKIIKLGYKDFDFGGKTTKKLEIRMSDGVNEIIIQIDSTSMMHNSLLNNLANTDLTSNIKLETSKGKGGEGTNIYIHQNGVNIRWKFTKENPGERPEPIFKTLQGKQIWDYSGVYDFWFNYCTNIMMPIVNTSTPKQHHVEEESQHLDDSEQELDSPTPSGTSNPNNDLPF